MIQGSIDDANFAALAKGIEESGEKSASAINDLTASINEVYKDFITDHYIGDVGNIKDLLTSIGGYLEQINDGLYNLRSISDTLTEISTTLKGDN